MKTKEQRSRATIPASPSRLQRCADGKEESKRAPQYVASKRLLLRRSALPTILLRLRHHWRRGHAIRHAQGTGMLLAQIAASTRAGRDYLLPVCRFVERHGPQGVDSLFLTLSLAVRQHGSMVEFKRVLQTWRRLSEHRVELGLVRGSVRRQMGICLADGGRPGEITLTRYPDEFRGALFGNAAIFAAVANAREVPADVIREVVDVQSIIAHKNWEERGKPAALERIEAVMSGGFWEDFCKGFVKKTVEQNLPGDNDGLTGAGKSGLGSAVAGAFCEWLFEEDVADSDAASGSGDWAGEDWGEGAEGGMTGENGTSEYVDDFGTSYGPGASGDDEPGSEDTAGVGPTNDSDTDSDDSTGTTEDTTVNTSDEEEEDDSDDDDDDDMPNPEDAGGGGPTWNPAEITAFGQDVMEHDPENPPGPDNPPDGPGPAPGPLGNGERVFANTLAAAPLGGRTTRFPGGRVYSALSSKPRVTVTMHVSKGVTTLLNVPHPQLGGTLR